MQNWQFTAVQVHGLAVTPFNDLMFGEGNKLPGCAENA
jgi:hypothetical protein